MQNTALSYVLLPFTGPNSDTVIIINWLGDRCVSWSFLSVCTAICMSTPSQSVWFVSKDMHANAPSSSPEWHIGVFMLMNVRRRDLVGHPWVHTGVWTCTHTPAQPCVPAYRHRYTHPHTRTHTPTHTCRLRLHTHWTLGCIIDKLLITLVAISADLSLEHPGSL